MAFFSQLVLKGDFVCALDVEQLEKVNHKSEGATIGFAAKVGEQAPTARNVIAWGNAPR
jgi:hypothetical protein